MELGIRAEELKLLGSFYQNDLLLDVVEENGCISLVPAKNAASSIRNLTITLAVLASLLCGGAAWLFSTRANESIASQIFTYLLFVLVWCCAVFGPYFGHTLRSRYLQSISPLLSFCSETCLVSSVTYPGKAKSHISLKSPFQYVLPASVRESVRQTLFCSILNLRFV
jgi:hypothetical protein